MADTRRPLAAALAALLLLGAAACGDDDASRDQDDDGGVTDPAGVDNQDGADSSTTVPTVGGDLTDDLSGDLSDPAAEGPPVSSDTDG